MDGVGNPTKVTDSTVGGTGAPTYSYDEANRLTNATYWDGSTQAYAYDAAGNRSSMVAGATTTPYAYDAAGRLLSAGATTYTYDNDGNRTSATTSGATTTYSYDQADRLIGATGNASPSTYISASVWASMSSPSAPRRPPGALSRHHAHSAISRPMTA